MKRCSNASTLCVAMLSVEIIVINLLIFIPSLHLDGDLVTIVTVCLSAFVLALSLLISQLMYDISEDEYHQCGMLLSALEKKIDIFLSAGKEINHEAVTRFDEEYQKILLESSLNHTKIDHEQATKDDNEVVNKYLLKKIIGKCYYTGLYFRWHLLRSDSIYNILTLLGAIAVILVAVYGKKSLSYENTIPEMIINIDNRDLKNSQ